MKPDLTRRDVLAMLAALGMTATESELVFAESSDTAGGKVIFENEKLRVISHLARTRAGVCGTGLHSHPPHLTVILTDVKAKVTKPGKEPFISEQKAGAVFWDPGGPHVVENLGSRETKVYLVELKA